MKGVVLLGLWLDQPLLLMFASLAGAFLVVCGLIWLLMGLPSTRLMMRTLGAGVAPPYIGAIAVLLALLTGFVANDAWDRHRQGVHVVQTERANLLAAYDLSTAISFDTAGIRQKLLDYAEALTKDEWPRMAEDGSASSRAGEALSALMSIVADPNHVKDAAPAAQAALFGAVMNLRSARGDRLALNNSQGDESKWVTLLVLAGLTLVTTALIHVERPIAQAVTMLIFSSGMVVTLGVIALHERPFDGPLAVRADPLQEAVEVMLRRQP
jgi:hypothetical protein